MPSKEHFERYIKALSRFDEENSQDPNTEFADGEEVPRELLYANRLTEWVLKLDSEASEALCLAARCQHLCRWMMPRTDYEMTKGGYLKWRSDLKHFHAEKSGRILRDIGYDTRMVEAVQALNLKKNFPGDTDSRTLEDALCLVFLEFQFKALAEKTDSEKVINALRKCWQKMTPRAHKEALKLPYSLVELSLLEQALGIKPLSEAYASTSFMTSP